MRRTITTLLAVFLAAAAATMSTSIARADDEGELEGLLNESVITTASKSAEVGATAPATTSTISAEDLRRFGIHSLDEALDFLSLGVVTQSSAGSVEAGARGVLLTGDRGSHFLILVDGHAMNEPLFGTAQVGRGAGVPMELVDHIEVILGPGSVLYGSNAMLGVINIITKRAKDFHGTHVIAESEVGKSYRFGVGAGYELPIFGGSELTLALDYYRQSGPKFYYDPQNFGIDAVTLRPLRFSRDGTPNGIWGGQSTHGEGAEAPTGMLRFVSGPFEISGGVASYKRSSPYWNQDFTADTYFDDASAYEVNRHAWADAKHHVTLSPVVQVSTRLYADSFDYQRYTDSSATARCLFDGVETCRLHTVGLGHWEGGELQTSFDWLRDTRLVTLVGIDGRVRSVQNKVDEVDYDTGRHLASSYGVIHATDETIGAYLQQTWNPARWFSFNGGARIDRDPRFNPVISPRVATTLQSWKGGSLKAVYAEAFRAPSIGESSSSGPDQLAAPVLRPERVRSVEASIEQRFGVQRLLFGAFRSWWTDMVELHFLNQEELIDARRQGLTNLTQNQSVTQYRNVGSIDNYGLNATFDGASNNARFRYALNVTASIARRTDTVTQPLTVAPRIFGNARVSYDFEGAWPDLALGAHFVSSRPADRAFDSGFSPIVYAPASVELRATLSGDIPFVHGLTYRVSANYISARTGPYFVGPSQTTSYIPGITSAASNYTLSPIDTFRTTIGLQWSF